MEDIGFERLLKICRLHLTVEEAEKIRKDIEEVVAYFGVLDETNTDGAEPAYHPVEMLQLMGNDREKEFENKEGLLSNAKTYRFYLVGPKV